jgi:hypothetical protein
VGSRPEDELSHLLERVRPLVDHQVDRPDLEGR